MAFFIAPDASLRYVFRMRTIPITVQIEDIITNLQDHKAQDILDMDISTQAGNFADHLLLVTASSQRHARSLADAIADLCHDKGYEYLRVEGYREALWILVDLNDIVVNIFQADTRELYRLEDLWGNLPKGNA